MHHLAVAVALFMATGLPALATQADDAIISLTEKNPGPTAFIYQLTLTANDTSSIKSVQFTVSPKPGSVTRPLSGTYSTDYLLSHGYLEGEQIFLPVYGLYAGYNNTVTLTYRFVDGSSKQATVPIQTSGFDDPCGYDKPTVLQPRTESTSLSYDYILIRGSCSDFSPAVIDTDGALRWVGPGGFSSAHSNFFDNAFYIATGTSLYRIELDGTVTFLHDYSDIGVVSFHHNVDRGKNGLILDVNTSDHKESLNLEVDAAGNVIKSWDMVDIITEVMRAGGDDPDQFVFPASEDWFHNNAVAYNRADDSLVVSSRENFVVCIDYETAAIKWILGDKTKAWYQFPSLAQYALDLAPGSLPPIGQHAVSITYDQDLMVFDNGKDSDIHEPPGEMRTYASPRKYRIDLDANLATEVWNYEMDQSVRSGICSGIYEDQPLNYLVDYADVNGPGAPVQYVQLLGLDRAGEKTFYYQYSNVFCITAFNVLPLHLENTSFPTVGPQALNLSTRATTGQGDASLIAGFIVTGKNPKTVVLRALGPSLRGLGVPGALSDPELSLFDSAQNLIQTNDDWQNDSRASEVSADGLGPADPAEAALAITIDPGLYTVVVSSKDTSTGVALVEAYDVSPNSGSHFANISTRGYVGSADSLLINGFIVGDVGERTVVVRALGPSLTSGHVTGVLSDPTLTVYDQNGAVIAFNNDWQDGDTADEVEENSLAPPDSKEAASALFLAAGAYTAIVQGLGNTTGIGLVEIYEIE